MTAAGRLEIAAQWLVLGVLILLPVGRISELPVLIACIGAFLLVALLRGHAWNGTAARSVLLLFASYWLPILFSAFDAVNPHKTWMVALETLRFLPFALFVAWALRDRLGALGARTVPVTSGSKGIHVYVPMDEPITSGQASDWARLAAEQLEQALPELWLCQV